jgi:hypothetical protein
MKVLYLNKPYDINLVPRVYPLANEDLVLTLRNESTQLTFEPEIEYLVNGLLTVSIIGGVPLDEFQSMNKYELTLKNGLSVVYKGKLIVVDESTDIQNYAYTDQTNSRFTYI